MLDPTGAWIDLAEFGLGERYDLPSVIENDRTAARGALIECEDVAHRLDIFQGLFEIGFEVIDALDSDGKPKQAIGNAGGDPVLQGNRSVSHRG